MYLALLGLLFLVFGIIAWRDFQFALALVFALLPSYLLRFSIGPIPTTALEILIGILVLTWVIKNGRHLNLHSARPFHTPLLLTFGAACLATAIAPDLWSALGIWKAYYIEPILVLLMVVSTFRTHEDWRAIGKALCASAIAVSAFGILQFFTGWGLPMPWLLEGRITSIYDFPNAVGLFLAPIIAYAIVQFLHTKGRQRALFAVTIALGTITILLAKTEAALIAIPVALGIILLLSERKMRTKIVVTGLAIVLGVAALMTIPIVREKLLLHDISGQARRLTWHETTRLLKDTPFFGAGLSGFPTAIAPYHNATYFEIFQYPHNLVLNVWVELGLLGLVALVAWGVVCAKKVWQYRSDPLALSIAAALMTMIIHGLVDVPFMKNDLALLTVALLSGLLITSKTPHAA